MKIKMAASMSLTLGSRNLCFPSKMSFAVKRMIGPSQLNPFLYPRTSWLAGQRSICQSAVRLAAHQPTGEPRDPGPAPVSVEERDGEPEFYAAVPPESAEQQSLLLASPSNQPKDSRISRVAIIGTPNAGKSTLINSLLGRRICAVSQKVHTTMRKALAVITHRNTQVVLLDTPGLISFTQGRRHKLPKSLLVDAKNTLLESDLVAVLVDVSNKWTNMKLDPEIIVQLHTHSNIPSVLVLNKVDAVQTKQSLFEITEALTEGIVDGKEFASPRRKGKFRNRIRESLESAMTNERHGEEERKDGSMVVPGESGLDVESEGTVSSRSSTTSEHGDAVRQGHWTGMSVNEDEQIGLHAQNHDRLNDEPLEVSITDPVMTHTQRHESHMMNQVKSQVTEGNTLQSHDLDRKKKDILQQYAANLFELSDDGDDAVARQPSGGEEEEERMRMEMEREEMEKKREENRRMWRMAKERSGWPGFKAVYMVSALNGDGVADLKDFLVSNAKPGDWEYHEDVVTNLSPEEILKDAIREKLLETLPQEVPYNISQSTELWRTEEGGEIHIVQMLICHKKSHVRMLEKKLGWIGQQATQDLMDAFHCDVKLSLHVQFNK